MGFRDYDQFVPLAYGYRKKAPQMYSVAILIRRHVDSADPVVNSGAKLPTATMYASDPDLILANK
jgi:hypothetical protein